MICTYICIDRLAQSQLMVFLREALRKNVLIGWPSAPTTWRRWENADDKNERHASDVTGGRGKGRITCVRTLSYSCALSHIHGSVDPFVLVRFQVRILAYFRVLVYYSDSAAAALFDTISAFARDSLSSRRRSVPRDNAILAQNRSLYVYSRARDE